MGRGDAGPLALCVHAAHTHTASNARCDCALAVAVVLKCPDSLLERALFAAKRGLGPAGHRVTLCAAV